MAQSGFTPIKLYLSTTAAAVPTAGNLEPGELALNNNDGKLFYEDSAGVVQVLATKAGASGTVTSVAVSGGTTGLTTSGGPITSSGTITLAGTLGVANGGTGLTSVTSNRVPYGNGTSALQTSANLTFNGTTLTNTGNAVISDNSANAALRITQVGSGNALLVEDEANPDSTPFVVTNNGRAIVGYTGDMGDGGLQLKDTTQSLYTYAANAFVNSITNFYKSRSTTPGVFSAVQSGDELGFVVFRGDDGTAFRTAALIGAQVDGTPGTNDMPGRLVFSTTADGASSPTERMRIDNQGRVGIGGTPSAGQSVTLTKGITGAVTGYGILTAGVVSSDVTTQALYNGTFVGTAAASFTLGSISHYFANQGTIGAGSTVTNQYGFHANSALTGATNNFGFYSNIASGTGRWNFYAAGSAANYMAGVLGLGATSTDVMLDVNPGTLNTVRLRGNSGGLAYMQFVPAGASSEWAYISSTSSNLDINHTTLVRLLTGGAERMRIASSGGVSIGNTTDPGATNLSVTGTISGGTVTGTVDGTNAIGFRTIPQNSQSAAYTLVLTDSGKQIFHPSADTTARTFTIPANASVAYPIGTAVTFINQNGAGVITIAITSDTMRLAGAGTTGSRTLAANGVATAIKVTATEWIISGTGLS